MLPLHMVSFISKEIDNMYMNSLVIMNKYAYGE